MFSITSTPEGHRYRGVSGIYMHEAATTGARCLSSWFDFQELSIATPKE
jgi:hypothetical protein